MIQEQMLNKILDTKDSSIITLNNLNSDYFSDYVKEFNFIKNHLQQYSVIPDKETFLNVFPDFDLMQVNEPVNYLLEELMKDKTQRFLVNNYTKVRDLIMSGDSEKALSLLKDAAEESTSFVSLQATDLIRDTSRYDSYEDKVNNPNKYFIKTGFDELDNILGGWDINEDLVTIVARNGLGKCFEKGTKCLMADGTIKKIEDIKPGDKVQSEKDVNTVEACHHGRAKGYKIIPKLGEPFVVSAQHILTLMKRHIFWDPARKITASDNTFELVDMPVEDYMALSKSQQHKYQLYRPAVSYNKKDLKIPPYILGCWLGDGTSCRPELTNMDKEVIEEWQHYARASGLRARMTTSKKSKAAVYDITGTLKNPNTVLKDFKSYNLLSNKHIPLDYLTSSEEDRLELLAGLLDTDGHLSNTVHGNFEICLKSEVLINQIAQLARGLGFRVGRIYVRKIQNEVKGLCEYYKVNITGDLTRIPNRVTRKKSIKNSTRRKLALTDFRIEELGEIEYYGFQCDGDHRFLLADNTLVHNSWIALKCAAAAAAQGKSVGLYSGEMSEDSVGYRIDSILGHISNGALVHGSGSIKNQYKNYLEKLSQNISGKLYVLTPKQINGPATVTALRAFIEKYNLDILFVDQHSLLEDDSGAKNPVEKASNISKQLKLLQTVKRIPIITVSQQNREKLEDGKTFDTTQVAQSDRIAQDSSVIIFLERKEDIMKLHLVKSRQSGSGQVLAYKIDLNQGIWQYIAEGDTDTPVMDGHGNTYSEEDVF